VTSPLPELIAAKAQIPHGGWLPWIETEFGWSDKTAQKYMMVAKSFGKIELSSDLLAPVALYALAAPDVPEDARAEAVGRAEAGELITKAEAEEMVVGRGPRGWR
jgi:Protein of unknown function (DUF3102)